MGKEITNKEIQEIIKNQTLETERYHTYSEKVRAKKGKPLSVIIDEENCTVCTKDLPCELTHLCENHFYQLHTEK